MPLVKAAIFLKEPNSVMNELMSRRILKTLCQIQCIAKHPSATH